MSDEGQITGSNPISLNVSEDVQQKFGDLVGMIQRSESMDDEERQYWVDALPIMTDEQVQNLRHILENERQQIEAAQSNYKEGVKEDARQFNIDFDAEKYREKKRMWKKMEEESENKEQQDEEAILKEIEAMEV